MNRFSAFVEAKHDRAPDSGETMHAPLSSITSITNGVNRCPDNPAFARTPGFHFRGIDSLLRPVSFLTP